MVPRPNAASASPRHCGRAARSSGACRRLRQRAAAARSLAGGAAIAMACDADRPPLDVGVEQVRQVHALACIMPERQIKHLIEVAVVDEASPIHRNQISAHDVLEIGVNMRTLQQIEVTIELTVGDKRCTEPLDGHVGQRIEAIEDNAIALAEHAPVIFLERALWRGERRSLWVIEKVGHATGFGPTLTQTPKLVLFPQ